ncbi:hypothetical protein FB45DRAFT_951888, partial [Roridomyces roridus]
MTSFKPPRAPQAKQLWFSDGDIVLDIQRHLLKVYRKRLLCSIIFNDMLCMPRPTWEQLDLLKEAVRVKLTSDEHKMDGKNTDLLVFLSLHQGGPDNM